MKPKVAFFDFAGCEGDQLQVANLEEDILALLGQVEVVSFREVMKEHSDNYDIAFVEGSCTRLQDEDRLRQIRKNAKIVVAIGSCAAIGGINSLRNYKDLDDVKKTVYGENAKLFDSLRCKTNRCSNTCRCLRLWMPNRQRRFLTSSKVTVAGKET